MQRSGRGEPLCQACDLPDEGVLPGSEVLRCFARDVVMLQWNIVWTGLEDPWCAGKYLHCIMYVPVF